MSLLDRLIGTESPRLSVHGFQAAMSEWADGAAGFSRSTIISEFNLTGNDLTELDSLKAIFNSANTNAKRLRIRKAFDNVLLMASDRDVSFYKTKAEINARLTEAAS